MLLWTALAVLVVAHFCPMESRGGGHLWDVWLEVAREARRLADGDFSLDGMMGSASVIIVTVVMVAAPFAVEFLIQARPLLWTMRLLSLAFSGWFSYMVFDWTRPLWKGMSDMGVGLQLLVLALWLATAGFWRIPGRTEEQAS